LVEILIIDNYSRNDKDWTVEEVEYLVLNSASITSSMVPLRLRKHRNHNGKLKSAITFVCPPQYTSIYQWRIRKEGKA